MDAVPELDMGSNHGGCLQPTVLRACLSGQLVYGERPSVACASFP